MTQVQYYASPDWLRYSVPLELPLRDAVLPAVVDLGGGEPCKGRYGYTEGVALDMGHVYWSPDHPEFKRSIEFSGQEIAKLVNLGIPFDALVRQALSNHAKISRLDLALDVWNDRRASARSFFAHWVSGDIHTTAKKATMIGDTEKKNRSGELTPVSLGDTVYLGSRNSERMLRVYDKGKQLEIPGEWLRMELELKDRMATIAGAEIIARGLEPITSSHLNCMIRTAVPWIKDALAAYPTYGLPGPGDKQTDWEKWIAEIALPNVLKAYHAGIPFVVRAIENLNR